MFASWRAMSARLSMNRLYTSLFGEIALFNRNAALPIGKPSERERTNRHYSEVRAPRAAHAS